MEQPLFNIAEESRQNLLRQKINERISIPCYKILRFLSEVGFATKGQIIRLIQSENPQIGKYEIEQNLQELKNKEFIGVFSVTPPKHLGFGMLKIKTFYAKEKARQKVRALNISDESLAFGRFGKPIGENLKRVIHELLVTECYLWMIEVKGVTVIWFMGENEIKSKMGKMRWDRIKRNPLFNQTYEGTGDFKIGFYNPQKEAVSVVAGEASIKYTKEQIAKKPANLNWFCVSESQARLIEEITHKKPHILNRFLVDAYKDAISELNENPITTDSLDKTIIKGINREVKILEILEKMGGCCSTDVLAKILGISVSLLTIQRDRFCLSGRIKVTRAKLMPGTTRGASQLIWYLPNFNLDQFLIKMSLLRAAKVLKALKYDWELDYFDNDRFAVVLKSSKRDFKIAIACDSYPLKKDFKENLDSITKLAKISEEFEREKGIVMKWIFSIFHRWKIAETVLDKKNMLVFDSENRIKSYYTLKDLEYMSQ